MTYQQTIQRLGCLRRYLFTASFILSAFWFLPGNATAELEGTGLTPEQEQELAFADALLDARLPNYAAMVLERLDLAAEIMAMREIRALTARGEFDAARAVVDANPGRTQEAMALRLALADGFHAWGRYAEAQAIYEEFFAAFPSGPSDSIKPFFMSSAYRYAQMMILIGNRSAAAEAYRMALRANPERHIERQLQAELAELLIMMARDTDSQSERNKYLEEVQQLAENILWVQDLWFGRAVVLLANIRVLQGDIDGAMRLVDDYSSQLRTIDQALRDQSADIGEDLTRLSPMAQARYLIGEILHDRALEILEEGGHRDEALGLLIGGRRSGRQVSGAVQHFLNVFIRYPNTSWAPHAGNRFRQVEDLLDREFGRQVQVEVTPEQWSEVERAQFREARALFNQGRFSEATESYLQVLNLFPEQSTSVPALGELAASLIEQESFTLADAVARHVAERFNQNEDLSTEAGNQVIRIANKFQEVNQPERHLETYQVFFEYFERHPRTLLDMQRFAREAMAAQDFETAMELYMQIATRFRGRDAYFDALSNIARIFREQGEQERKVQILRRAISEMAAADMQNHLRVNLTYRLANVMREMGGENLDLAQQIFRQVRQMLTGENRAAFAANEREAEGNAFLLQGAMFFSAIADAMRTTVPNPIRQRLQQRAERELSDEEILNNFFKAGAIRQLNDLVQRFPDSPYAAAALSQIGTLNTFLGRAEEASEALRRLERDYPDSPEAANAVFQIGLNLLEIGMRDDAVDYFARMFQGEGAFSVPQIVTAGQKLIEEGEYQIALTAFERVIAESNERRQVEPARVGKGRALFGLGRYQAAAEWFDQVIADYPQSGLTIVISRTASEANAALASETDDGERRRALFNRAVELMRRALQFAQEPSVQAQIEVAVARILERRSEAEARFGTSERATNFRNEAVAAYQTVMMFRDASDPAVAPHIQTAFGRAVPMMVEIERWQDVFDDAREYLNKFPNGRYASEMRSAITTARTRGDISE